MGNDDGMNGVFAVEGNDDNAGPPIPKPDAAGDGMGNDDVSDGNTVAGAVLIPKLLLGGNKKGAAEAGVGAT